jgi:hypothetical protein
MPTTRPFCDSASGRIRPESEAAIAIPDVFPVAEGHTLVVPKRHVANLFDLSEAEQAAVWRLVAAVRAKVMTELHPDGFNIGVNNGAAARRHPNADRRMLTSDANAFFPSGWPRLLSPSLLPGLRPRSGTRWGEGKRRRNPAAWGGKLANSKPRE